MVDTYVSGAYGAIHAGSSPASGIFCCLIFSLGLKNKKNSLKYKYREKTSRGRDSQGLS